ncbi:MAG: hypothetical protein IJ204_00635 [Paludibacteraceae bacterium]|nr:hypothetical protein [Paludibacteraceae bacterium]
MKTNRIHRILLNGILLAAALLVRPVSALGQCIDFYDLNGPSVTCEYGLYSAIEGGSAWSTRQGGVNYGMNSASSRHTVHNAVGRYDERTVGSVDYLGNPVPGGLLEIPAGEQKSVRLGNWLDGNANEQLKGEAERITYDFHVTEGAPFLQIKYAVVWESPNHTELAPRFKIEFLKENNTPATVSCGEVDIDVTRANYMNHCTWTSYNKIFDEEHTCNRWQYNNKTHSYECVDWLGAWINDVGDHDVYWQDWQTMGVSLQNYIGQTIRIRITAGDCGYTAHFGYAYFTVRCVEANLFAPECGDENSTNTFTAPAGFEYAWYKLSPDSNRLSTDAFSTSQSVEVQSNRQLYECEVQTPGNASCAFKLYAQSEPRLPKADFSIDFREACVDTIYLTDMSAVSPDGVVPYVPHRDVDEVEWDLGDGRVTKENMAGRPIVYAHDGTYTIKQTARLLHGNCEDVKIRTVTVRGTETKHEAHLYDTICSNDFVMFDGVKRNKTDVYTKISKSTNGFCDSTTYLHLKVWDAFYREDTIDICQGEKYKFHHAGTEKWVFSNGVYWDSCQTAHQCDSVYKLVLRVHPKHFFHIKDTICEGQSYPFHKNNSPVTYTTSGTYFDSLHTETWGCDSVYRLDLHVKPSYHFTESRTFCQGETFHYRGHDYTEGGIYTVPFTSAQGCDSVYTLNLTRLPSYMVDTVAFMTDKQVPFLFHNRIWCTGSGHYFDTLQTVNGCDSIIHLNLTVHPTYYFEDVPATICQGEVYDFHGIPLTQSGTYYDSLKTIHGRDSVYKIVLTVNTAYHVTQTAQMAEGSVYPFNGMSLTTGGTYVYNGHTTKGCDSIVTLILTAYPKYLIQETDSVCQGESYTYHKNGASIVYDHPGTYYDSLKTIHGYDSVYKLVITPLPKYYYTEESSICAGETKVWHGQTLTTPGIYYDNRTTVAGCDSIYQLTLSVRDRYEKTIKDTICEGEHYVFGGVNRTAGGVYTEKRTTSTGCDSITHLALTVLPAQRVSRDEHICAGDYFEFKGRHITTAGIYVDTLTSMTGCDSIVTHHLYIHGVKNDTVRAKICEGDEYIFHGSTFTTPGTHTLPGQSAYGCDSTYVLILTVNPRYTKDTTFTLCQNNSITFNGHLYTSGGDYVQTLHTAAGCDSVFRIHIDEYPKFFAASSASLCLGDSILWHGRVIKTGGIYYDSLKSVYGCDSVYQHTVIARTPFKKEWSATIPGTGYYDFNGRPLTQSGVYCDTFTSVLTGCDSIFQLTLTVLPTYDVPLTRSICEGDTVMFNGKTLTRGGLYIDTLHTVHGVDSIVRLNLIVYRSTVRESIVHISDQEPYTWRGNTYTHSGTYDDSTTSVISGCDSINRLRLYVHPTYLFEENHSICDGYYQWRGRSYDLSGTYYDSLRTDTWGYDSVYVLHLTVNPVYRRDTTVHICDGGYYIFGGTPRYEGGTYRDTLTARNGCDSILTLTLIKHPVDVYNETHAICKGDSYPWRGRTLTASNLYRDTVRSALTGCDSLIYNLNLIVRMPYFQEEHATICGNKFYQWRGRSLNVAGTYYDSLKSAYFPYCDSVYCLHLAVHPSYDNTITHTMCEGDYYMFAGRSRTEGGIYVDSATSVLTGCDSVTRLILNVKPILRRTVSHTMCEGDNYTWHGRTYSSSGLYSDTLLSSNGCDSVVTLQLTVNPRFYEETIATICGNENYTFRGRSYNQTGTYYDSLKTSRGCDSVYCLRLTVNQTYETTIYNTICEGEYVMFGGQSRSVGGVYTQNLKTTKGCDSIIHLNLTVLPKIRIDRDVHLCDGDYFDFKGNHITTGGIYADTTTSVSGCDSITTYHVYFHRSLRDTTRATICQGKEYFFHGQTFTTQGTHTIVGHSPYHCDSTYVLILSVSPTYSIDTTLSICTGDYVTVNSRNYYAGGIYYDSLKTVGTGCDSIYTIRINEYPKFLAASSESLCLGDSILWHGRVIKEGGIYYDSLKTEHGCDSVYQHTVIARTPFFRELEVTIPGTSYYDFNGKVLRDPGVYRDTFPSILTGCDSIIQLTLNVLPAYDINISHEMCEGETYMFGGKTLTKGGYYIDTLQTIHGVDSIVRLSLTVYHQIIRETIAHISDKQSYTWNGNNYTMTGVYDDTTTSVITGCDSINRLRLSVHPTYVFVENQSSCANEFYNFHGRPLNVTGTYYDSLKTAVWNYDSVYVLNLTVHPIYRHDTTVHICDGDYYTVAGRPVYEGGTYIDTLPTMLTGCDSIFRVTIIKHPVSSVSETKEICKGSIYNWHGRALSETGIYRDTIKSVLTGCDSLQYMLTLTVRKPFYQEEVATICGNEHYTFRGRSYNQTGVYYDSLQSPVEPFCDSVYCLRLTVNPTRISRQRVDICSGSSYSFSGKQLSIGGIYRDTLLTEHGCDSIVELTLYVHDKYTIDTVAHIEDGTTLQWYGRSLSAAGDYYENRSTVWGCDSIVHLRLYTHPSYHFTETAQICQGDYYEWHGQQLHTQGTHTLALHSIYGYDSIYTLTLTVKPTYVKDINDTICTGETYYFINRPLRAGGYYVDTLTTSDGCDSIFRLTLKENQSHLIESEKTICSGETYPWHGRNLTTKGVYYDSLLTDAGCDSVYKLTLKVNPSYRREVRATICSNEYYDFYGTLLNTTGEYDYTMYTAAGCDSTIHLYLTVNPAYPTKDLYVTICEGQHYTFAGRALTAGGIYVDSLKTKVGGCDSIVRLNLTVNPVSRVPIAKHICQGETYTFNGKTLSTPGQYIDTLTSVLTGCDSIVTLQLYVHAPFYNTVSPIVCAGEAYDFHGMKLTASGTYTLPGYTQWGCDSTYVANLTVNPTYIKDTTIYLCKNKEIVIFGKSYTRGGNYVDTLSTKQGCDSIYRIKLIENLSSFIPESRTFCRGSEYIWRGRTLTTPGVYYDSLTTMHGCDSVYQLTLTMLPVFYQEENATICANEYYDFHHNQYNQTGVYYDSLTSLITGCDSIYKLNLTVNPTYGRTLFDTICEGESVIFDGQSRTQGGVYKEYRTTEKGCDSITYLNLTVLPKQRIYRDVHLCEGEYFDFHGRHVVTAGLYVDTATSVTGCDSITTYHVYVHRVLRDTTRAEICRGKEYPFHGQTYTATGTYTIHGQSMFGCDSSYVLVLKVNPTYTKDTTFTLCSGDYVTLNGKKYSNGGEYYDTLLTASGCDSIFHIRINEYPKFFDASYESLCLGDSILWHGRIIKTGGVYYDSLKSVHGCDSVYKFTVIARTPFYQELEATIPGTSYYVFNGKVLKQSGVYCDTFTSVLTGCDSIYKLTLTVHPTYDVTVSHEMCEGETFLFNGRTYSEGGLYTDTLHTIHGVDSIVRLNLIVYRQIIRETIVHISDKESYTWRGLTLKNTGVYDDSTTSVITGCDSINRLRLYVHPTYRFEDNQEICQGKYYNFRGKQLDTTGVYYDSLKTDIWNYDSVYVLTLTVNPTYRHDTIVEICAGGYYTFNGTPIYDGGTYFDTIQTQQGCDSIFKLTLIKHPSNYIEESRVICSGDTYEWHGKSLTKSGVYYDSLRSVITGCDSIYKLTLNVHNEFYREIVDSICQGEYYNFHGLQLNAPGVYWDSAQSLVTGCDSVYKLLLYTRPSYRITVVDTICEGESYMFDGHAYKSAGTYIDTIPTMLGCDSIRRLILTVNPVTVHEKTVHLCQGETCLSPTGQVLSSPGLYIDTLQATTGCDSIFRTRVYVHAPFYDTISATICQGQYYDFLGRRVSEQRIYKDSTVTQWGCDSIHVLYLTVNPTYSSDTTVQLCQGDYVMFNGNPITTGGVYSATVQTVNGCDSVLRMKVISHPTSYIEQTHTMCESDVYEWHGRRLVQAGVYYDSLQSRFGCDSVFRLTLNTTHEFYQEINASICSNEYYNFNGRQLKLPGVYWDSARSVVSGCDSVYRLDLTVKPAYDSTIYHTMCEGDYVMFNGNSYTVGGHYVDTLSAIGSGCDSVVRMVLNVKPALRRSLEKHICRGDSYVFNGRTLSTPGSYVDTLVSSIGCDSIVTLRLYVHSDFYQHRYVTLCQGEYYEFHERLIYEAGTYTDSLISHWGCDSVYAVTVTVNPAYAADTTVSLCDGDYFTFNGHTYTNGGFYIDTALTRAGCDSVLRITIVHHPVSIVEENAVICEGETYSWYGRTLSRNAIYYDTVRTVSGQCDSIIHRLTLTVHPTFYQEEVATICSNENYIFRGKSYQTTGDYYDSLQTAFGCDSVYCLKLTVNPASFTAITDTLCQGEVRWFGGRQLTTSGIYYDTIRTALACDSVVQLALTVHPVYHVFNEVDICHGDSVLFGTRYLYNAGIYTDSLTTIHGCDSIVRMQVHVHSNLHQEWTETICQGDYYNFHGRLLSEEGVYSNIMTSEHGCDSSYVLNLKIAPTYKHDVYAKMCANEYYMFNGRPITAGGVYTDTFRTVFGCDSIVTLHLSQYPIEITPRTATICRGDTLYWMHNGQTVPLTKPGIYDDTLRSMIGNCDSIIRLTLHVRDTYFFPSEVTVCSDEPYLWRNRLYTETGVYYDSLQTLYGCDSVYCLNLTVKQAYFHSWNVELCNGERYDFNGRFLTQTGTYSDTLRAVNGCDSILQVTVIAHMSYHFYEEKTICESDTYYFNGRPVNTSGFHRDSFTTVYGCDSIYTLLLTVKHDYFEETNAVICSDERYVWQGQTYTRTGTYYDAYTTSSGCDSVYKLNLTVNPSYFFTEQAYICDMEKYYYNGKYLTQSGLYYDSLLTRAGCDSVYRLNLTVTPTRRDTSIVNLCLGDAYDYYGTPLTRSGLYRDTINDPVTRRCVITMLDLAFTAPTVISNVIVDEACADDQNFALKAYFSGGKPETYSILFNQQAHNAGFVDLLDQPYEDYISAPMPTFADSYVRPDYYAATLILDNQVCANNADNTYDFQLLVRYPSWIIEQNWNDVVALLNDRYNGGYLFSKYDWYINGNQVDEHGPYIYMPQTLAIGDEVVVAPTRRGEEYAVPSCPIIIYDKTPELVSDFPVFVQPSQVHGQFKLNASTAGTYTLISLSGIIMAEGTYNYGDQLTVDTPAPAGCYVLRLATPTYGTRTVKIILR